MKKKIGRNVESLYVFHFSEENVKGRLSLDSTRQCLPQSAVASLMFLLRYCHLENLSLFLVSGPTAMFVYHYCSFHEQKTSSSQSVNSYH